MEDSWKIVYERVHIKQKNTDQPTVEKWLQEEWPKFIASYSPENVYNANEKALYFRALPDNTYLF